MYSYFPFSTLAVGSLAFPSIFSSRLFGGNSPGNRLNVALIGCGNQGVDNNLRQILALGQNVIAVCDVDIKQAQRALKVGGSPMAGAKIYTDYRKLLESEKSLDAVLIATPDHCLQIFHAGGQTCFLRETAHKNHR